MNIEELKSRTGYTGKPKQWQQGFDIVVSEAKLDNNGWISVDEDLPFTTETVLLHTDDGIQVGTLDVSVNNENWYINDLYDGTEVYHWMPLPAAPEKAQEKVDV